MGGVVGVVPKMAENEPRTHARQPGGTPQRGEAVRRRSESSESSDGEEKDRRWHEKRDVPFVDVGSTFKVEETLFRRTGFRDAECCECDRPFNKYTYHLRALRDHAVKCQRSIAKRATATTDEWTGDVETSVAFENEESTTVAFEKIVEGGRLKLRCRACGDKLTQTAAYFRNLHVETHHKPEALVAEKAAEKKKTAAEKKKKGAADLQHARALVSAPRDEPDACGAEDAHRALRRGQGRPKATPKITKIQKSLKKIDHYFFPGDF